MLKYPPIKIGKCSLPHLVSNNWSAWGQGWDGEVCCDVGNSFKRLVEATFGRRRSLTWRVEVTTMEVGRGGSARAAWVKEARSIRQPAG